jgi:hypothetical protein
MKIKELIKELSKLDPELLVVLSKDSEGNGYGECCDISKNYSFDGDEIKITKMTADLVDQGFGEDDLADGDEYIPCVVLWP